MPRNRLPDRRPAVTREVLVELDSGNKQKLIVTFGFRDEQAAAPEEVFCASFKAGTAMNATVMDACVLLSRLMQHGIPASEIADRLCKPPSLVGAIALAAAEFS